MDVRIIGVNLPGRTWAVYENVHVGVQRKTEVVDLVPGDVDEAVWDFSVDAPTGNAGMRGPYVQGRRGERFFYLSWVTVGPDGTFEMFPGLRGKRAKVAKNSATNTG